MKISLFLSILFITVFYLNPAFSADDVITKEVCLSSFGKNEKTIKEDLLIAAKRSAVEELFGTSLKSFSKTEKSSLTIDQIETSTAGFVRIKGNPDYKNGQNMGEICIKIDIYNSEEDKEKILPKNISKKVCLSEGDVKSIIKTTEKKAKIEAVKDFDPSLSAYGDDVAPLLKEAFYSDSGFVEGTTTYCTKVNGVIHPIEVSYMKIKNEKIKKGNISNSNEDETGDFNIKGKWVTLAENPKDNKRYRIEFDIYKKEVSKKSGTVKFYNPYNCYVEVVFSHEEENKFYFDGISGRRRGTLSFGDLNLKQCNYGNRYSFTAEPYSPGIRVKRKYVGEEDRFYPIFKR